MSDYRRNFVPGATYFFTVVTQQRQNLFAAAAARKLLGNVMRECFERHPVTTIAAVLLYDHLHTLWELPSHDSDFSLRWRWIKREFTRRWCSSKGMDSTTQSTIWQNRFWEHTIRDEVDLENHFDYIHFNPVKHGYVTRPREWEASTFHRWVRAGHYNRDWGAGFSPAELPGSAGE